MEILYFGDGDNRLFGCHHRPLTEVSRKCAVVLCHPIGREYMLAYGATKQLAARLAHIGFDVLRFDYYGTGDSAGEFSEASVDRWLRDIKLATAEVMRRSDNVRCCLVGLRLGGTLAALAAPVLADVGTVVIWNPVVRGADYVQALEQLQLALVRSLHCTSDRTYAHRELLGFLYSETLYRQLQETDLLALECSRACPLLYVNTDQNPLAAELQTHLTSLGFSCAVHTQADIDMFGASFRRYDLSREPYRPNVPTQTLTKIVSWLDGVMR